jgi:hypothetical protein
MAPPRKPRAQTVEKARRALRPAKPQEASDDTAPAESPGAEPTATRKRPDGEAVRKKVIARLRRLHPMD